MVNLCPDTQCSRPSKKIIWSLCPLFKFDRYLKFLVYLCRLVLAVEAGREVAAGDATGFCYLSIRQGQVALGWQLQQLVWQLLGFALEWRTAELSFLIASSNSLTRFNIHLLAQEHTAVGIQIPDAQIPNVVCVNVTELMVWTGLLARLFLFSVKLPTRI